MTKEEFKACVYEAFHANEHWEQFLECVGQLYVENCPSWVIAKKLDNGKIELHVRNNNRGLCDYVLTRGEAKELMRELYHALHDDNPIIWKDAQGDDLPDHDREVVVLVQHVPEYSDSLRVSFGHRPNPKGYVVVKGEKLYARTYDKGWNQPNVRYWLDARLPYEKEEIKGNQGEISLNRIIGTEEHIKIALDVMEKGGEQ